VYNLYKLYQITDATKAEAMKKEYLQNILNRVMHKSWTILPQMLLVLLKHSTYTKWYKLYEQEQFVTVLENSDALISQFSGDEIV
jgi:hypothetical protein